MICLRHGAIATNEESGWALCSACFIEALRHADQVAIDTKLRDFWARMQRGR